MPMDEQVVQEILQDIQVISFDVGFTLIYPHPPVGEVYAAIAAKYGYPADPLQVHNRLIKTWQQKIKKSRSTGTAHPLAAEDTAFSWWQEIFNLSIGNHIPQSCLEIIFKECFFEYGRGKYWQIYEDVIPLLKILQKKYTLVILSNWDLRLQQTLWELKLDPFFKNIYISTQIGFAKPHSQAFNYILMDQHAEAGFVLHIGDSLADDFQAARSAGLKALHLNRQGTPSDPTSPSITSLKQLL